jgi:hypothetical protein
LRPPPSTGSYNDTTTFVTDTTTLFDTPFIVITWVLEKYIEKILERETGIFIVGEKDC